MAPSVPRQSVYFNPHASANQLHSIHACTFKVQSACATVCLICDECQAVVQYSNSMELVASHKCVAGRSYGRLSSVEDGDFEPKGMYCVGRARD